MTTFMIFSLVKSYCLIETGRSFRGHFRIFLATATFWPSGEPIQPGKCQGQVAEQLTKFAVQRNKVGRSVVGSRDSAL
jgi:hypothetical protein